MEFGLYRIVVDSRYTGDEVCPSSRLASSSATSDSTALSSHSSDGAPQMVGCGAGSKSHGADRHHTGTADTVVAGSTRGGIAGVADSEPVAGGSPVVGIGDLGESAPVALPTESVATSVVGQAGLISGTA